jgi:hypothetical protein
MVIAAVDTAAARSLTAEQLLAMLRSSAKIKIQIY